MDPGKVKAVLDWQPHKTQKQLQSFLGFANFYKQLIPYFAEVALPLTELLKTGLSPTKPKSSQPHAWTMDCQKAFEALKCLFAAEHILQHPDPTRPFIVQADASDVVATAILLQKDSQN
uniref:Reverse transcriptase/retrotransposon-derived protein RNase H-like domain-containing protein n=1 Tax=Micrurus corallinus TaxID=54390 RepID=A0A2D4F045_MICCO